MESIAIKDPLTYKEALLMKVIWSHEGDSIALKELWDRLNSEYGCYYVRNTVTTYVDRLQKKGFIKRFREGKFTYITALMDYDEYRQSIISQIRDLWWGGSVAELLAALKKSKVFTDEDKEEIKKLLEVS